MEQLLGWRKDSLLFLFLKDNLKGQGAAGQKRAPDSTGQRPPAGSTAVETNPGHGAHLGGKYLPRTTFLPLRPRGPG